MDYVLNAKSNEFRIDGNKLRGQHDGEIERTIGITITITITITIAIIIALTITITITITVTIDSLAPQDEVDLTELVTRWNDSLEQFLENFGDFDEQGLALHIMDERHHHHHHHHHHHLLFVDV